MAIIYTYPVKTDPAATDKVLISDSEDNNKTKSVSIQDIRSSTVSGVSSIVAGSNVTIDPTGGTGDVTVNATSYTAGDGIDINSYVISANLKANSGLVIDATELSLDLDASAISGRLGIANGGTGNTTFTAGFLKANGTSPFSTVANIDLSTTDVTGELPVNKGGTGAITLTSGGLLKGNGTAPVTANGDIGDLVSAAFSTASGGSLYFCNIPSAAPSTGDNIFIGSGSGDNITSVSGSNTIVGSGSVTALTSGGANVVIGTQAGNILQVGSQNTIVGRRANVVAQGDNNVVAIGSGASATLEGTAVGAESSSLRDGVAIGYEATAARNGIAIGSGSTAPANELALGSSNHALTTATGTATLQNYLKVTVNGDIRYIPLYTLS